jgi:hypothetical protein
MKSCYQTPTQSIWEHGQSVASYYEDIRSHLENGTALKHEWRLPDWISDPRILEGQIDRGTMLTYALWHDMGKPFCRTVDEDGRQHFPDHAAISAKLWRECGGDEQIARLITMDMDIHTLKAEGIAEFQSRPECLSLLLMGFAEINSNALLFGGIQSTGFKIKFKHIEKMGRRILSLYRTPVIS